MVWPGSDETYSSFRTNDCLQGLLDAVDGHATYTTLADTERNALRFRHWKFVDEILDRFIDGSKARGRLGRINVYENLVG